MKELDLLKKIGTTIRKVIYNFRKGIVCHVAQKSSSIVKWILIISIMEVVLWTVLSLVFNTDAYLEHLKHPEIVLFTKVLTYVNYAVILVFIYLFYTNYVKISATVATKQLMNDILSTRKTVQYYVAYNLGMLVFCLIIGFAIAFAYNPEMSILKDKIAHNPKILAVTIGIVLLTIGLFFCVFGLFTVFYTAFY